MGQDAPFFKVALADMQQSTCKVGFLFSSLHVLSVVLWFSIAMSHPCYDHLLVALGLMAYPLIHNDYKSNSLRAIRNCVMIS